MNRLYDIKYFFGEEVKNTGYDYSNTLLTKTISSYLFRNTKVSGFLTHLNGIMVQYIEMVKYIRIFKNYNVPKNYNKIN